MDGYIRLCFDWKGDLPDRGFPLHKGSRRFVIDRG